MWLTSSIITKGEEQWEQWISYNSAVTMRQMFAQKKIWTNLSYLKQNNHCSNNICLSLIPTKCDKAIKQHRKKRSNDFAC